jgi:Phage tail assembly chaperone protein
MEIRIQSTGAVVTEQEFRAMFPNTSLPVPLTESAINGLGGDIVFEGPQPVATRYQTVVRQGVVMIGDKWHTNYVTVDLPPEACAALDAQQAAAVRADRNARLAACDWTQLSDAPVDDLAWAVYRQALRDITSQPGFPWDITWPVEPQ